MRKTVISLVAILCMTLIAYLYFQSKQNNDKSFLHWQSSNEDNLSEIDHSIWQGILQTYVDITHEIKVNLFDYSNVDQEDKKRLADYIEQLSLLDPGEYRRIEQKAYWINLYNALTVQLILDNYPLESITKLGKKLTSFGPWDDTLVIINNERLSLNDIEHKILRPLWKDPRIHFAVNCASYGCPDLQDTAFTGENIESLLDKAATEYLIHPRGVYFYENELVLSSIFDWYAEDFGASSDEVLDYISKYLPNDLAGKLENHQGTIRYEYDWRLNDVEVFE